MNSEFYLGQNVMLTVDCPDDNDNLHVGDVGTVCHIDSCLIGIDSCLIGVNWHRDIGGHSCGDSCEFDYGWNVTPDEIVSVTVDEDNGVYVSDEEFNNFMLN